MQRNPQGFVAAHQALASATYTSTQTPSTGFDCRGWEELMIVINAGTFTSTAAMVITIQESSAADGSGDAFATILTLTSINHTATNDASISLARVKLQPGNRYIRAVATYAGSGNAVLGITFLKLWPKDTALCDTFIGNLDR